MVIALAGYNGFIGKNIRKAFVEDEFILLNRKDLYDSAETLAEKLKGSEIVINTAGFPVSVRWTRKNRREIFNSRILVTRNIVSAINILKNKPIKFISQLLESIHRTKNTPKSIILTMTIFFQKL